MSKNFGPLARTGTGSSSQSVLDTSLFHNSWKAEATNAKGEKLAVAEHTMLHPSGGIAYFHLLLDASGSTWKKVKTGDKKRVYEYLLKNFEHLVEGGETLLLPNDVICVWTFNRETTLLCRVERKDFRAQLETIRAAYEKEFDGNNCGRTRLYDAVAKVMERIREQYMAHKKADFFLVPFTDGMDYGSETTSLNGMMDNIQGIRGRLHTIFITANMPPASELYKRLESQQNEIAHINCEKTEPNEISRAFNTLRTLIKSYLVIVHQQGSDLHMTRIAAYGANKQDVAEKIMASLHSGGSSLLDGFYQLKRIQGRPAP